MEQKAKLIEIAGSCLVDPTHFVVDVAASSKNFSKITVIVDGDNGLGIDDCSGISRRISAKLEEAGFDASRFDLEVTTPGLDQPLRLVRQYRKNTGRQVKVHLKDKTIITGKLTSCTDNSFTIASEVKEGKKVTEVLNTILYEQADKTFVMISFK